MVAVSVHKIIPRAYALRFTTHHGMIKARNEVMQPGSPEQPISWFGRLLPLEAFPHLLNGQPATKLAVVMPLVALDFPLERLGLSFKGLNDVADAVLGRLFVLVPHHCVGSAQCRVDLAILVIGGPHELSRGDVLEPRGPFRDPNLLATVLC